MASHFGAQAAAYAAHRPILPPSVVAAILDAAGPHVTRIVDVACGSGQLTLALAAAAPASAAVVGLDAAPEQLAFARAADAGGRVEWRAADATATGEHDGSVDLLTVAQALHWFVAPAAAPPPPPRPFYAEVARVVRQGGTFAAVNYGKASLVSAGDPAAPLPAATALLHTAHDVTLAPFWPPERHLVIDGMAGLDPAPGEGFANVRRSATRMLSPPLTPAAIAGYVSSWSATAAAARAGLDVAAGVESGLAAEVGGGAATLRLEWPVTLLLATRARVTPHRV